MRDSFGAKIFIYNNNIFLVAENILDKYHKNITETAFVLFREKRTPDENERRKLLNENGLIVAF